MKQIPFLNKKFLSYKDFAEASFRELLPEEKINGAYKKQVFELGSYYFENKGNTSFQKHRLPFMAQISSVNDIALDDFNSDGFTDVLLVGNNYNINTQLGKLDASHGLILLNNKKGFFYESLDHDFNIRNSSSPNMEVQLPLPIMLVIHFKTQKICSMSSQFGSRGS